MYVLVFVFMMSTQVKIWPIEMQLMTKRNCYRLMQEKKTKEQSSVTDGLQCVKLAAKQEWVIK